MDLYVQEHGVFFESSDPQARRLRSWACHPLLDQTNPHARCIPEHKASPDSWVAQIHMHSAFWSTMHPLTAG
eukprot:1156977-Pelagomonas_calceolata.AAC.2